MQQRITFFSWVAALALLAAIVPACHHHSADPGPVIAPCDTGHPFTARFIGYEKLGDRLIETDSFLVYNNLDVIAPEGYVRYEWHIGGDTAVFRTNKVSLYLDYDQAPPGTLIPVRLIAKGKANTACFPNDDGIDTVDKIFTVIAWKDAPIKGVYVGYFGSDVNHAHLDTVRIEYHDGAPPLEPKFGYWQPVGINPGCRFELTPNGHPTWNGGCGVHTINIDSDRLLSPGCQMPVIKGLLENDSLKVDIQYNYPTASKDSYRGRHIRF